MATTTAPKTADARKIPSPPRIRKRLLSACRRLVRRSSPPFRPPTGDPAAQRLTFQVFRLLSGGEQLYVWAISPRGHQTFAGQTLRLLKNVCAETFNARIQVADAMGRNLGELDLVLAARLLTTMHGHRCTWRRALLHLVDDGHAPAELLSCLAVEGG